MKIRFLPLVALLPACLLFAASLSAQDTLRISIPDVVIEESVSSVDVPVYVFFDDTIAGFQMGVIWRPEELTFDSLTFGPALAGLNNNFSNNGPDEIKIVSIEPSALAFRLGPDTLAVTLHFSTNPKFAGYSPVIIDPDFTPIFIDEEDEKIPIIIENGSVTYGGPSFQTVFSPAQTDPATRNVCVDLVSDLVPRLIGFDFTLEWDSTAYGPPTVELGENPLGLDAMGYSITNGSIRFMRDTSTRDTSAVVPAGVPLLRLCFPPLFDGSTSDLTLASIPRSSFFAITSTGQPRSASRIIRRGVLTQDLFGPRDSVLLRIQPNFTPREDSLNCAIIYAENLEAVNEMDFTLEWPASTLRLASTNDLGVLPGFSQHGTFTPGTNSLRVRYRLPGRTNTQAITEMALGEVCFSATKNSCVSHQIALREGGATPPFLRGVSADDTQNPLPYRLQSGTAGIPIVDPFPLELNRTVADSTDEFHFLTVTAPKAGCVGQLGAAFVIDRTELEFVALEEVPNLNPSISIILFPQVGNDYSFVLSNDGFSSGIPNWLSAGEVLRLKLRRIGQQDSVALTATSRVSTNHFITLPDLPRISGEVILTDGYFLFRRDTSTALLNAPRATPISLYPNPADTEVFLSEPDHSSYDARILDATGRVITSKKLLGQRLSVAELPQGIYTLLLDDGMQTRYARLVISR